MPTLGCSNEGEVRTIPRALTRYFQFLSWSILVESILQFPTDYGADYRLIKTYWCVVSCAIVRCYDLITLLP